MSAFSGAAGALAPRLGLSTSRVDACRRKVQQAEDQRRFDAALAAGDCEAVRTLAPAVNKPQAGVDCDLAVALAADSPRRMFLAAVRFDTAGDQPRARQIYDAVMAKFPDDDLALDAARRLTQLADMDKQKAAADAQAAAQAAAVKAAEERAKAAEAAARKAADEAARQRQAAEEKAQAEKRSRQNTEAALLRVRTLIDDMNRRYNASAAAGRVLLSNRTHNPPFSWQVSTSFLARPSIDSPLTIADFCRVTITTTSNPVHDRINLPGNQYFTPRQVYSRLTLDFWSLDWAASEKFPALVANYGQTVFSTRVSNGKEYAGVDYLDALLFGMYVRSGLTVHEAVGFAEAMRTDPGTAFFQLSRADDITNLRKDLKSLASNCGIEALKARHGL